ncbi:DUF6907 domain-containing protein [Streptomyces sp. NPDC058108]|uniref:DUF6907 domain-containing protein n=1 Tax=Streptomyces sp. NPDC058108 TaxID=3346344 RepID=UPI0036E2E56B
MNGEPRTVTLPTAEGEITLPCPAWCAGHADHRPDSHQSDITHNSHDVILGARGRTLGTAVLSQAPYSEHSTREVYGFVTFSFESGPGGHAPVALHDLAASLDTAADQLRDLAAQLDAIRGGGQ